MGGEGGISDKWGRGYRANNLKIRMEVLADVPQGLGRLGIKKSGKHTGTYGTTGGRMYQMGMWVKGQLNDRLGGWWGSELSWVGCLEVG